MTTLFTNAVRKISLALAVSASFAAVSSTASFAFSSEARQQCTGDAFRLCSSEIPNIPKITACLDALDSGVRSAHLLDGRTRHVLLLELFTDAGIGTMIVPAERAPL